MKKRILIIAMSFIVLVMTIAGATTAYFTDTDDATNEFTVGKVDITLTQETNVSGETKVFPGQSYAVNPTITVAADSEDAYVGATITLKNVVVDTAATKIFRKADDTLDTEAVYNFLSDMVSTGYYVNYAISGSDVVITLVYNERISAGGSIKLFSNVTIPATWNHGEMENLKDFDVVVNAYAVQTVGFEAQGAAVALNAAFTSVGFPTASNYTPVTNP